MKHYHSSDLIKIKILDLINRAEGCIIYILNGKTKEIIMQTIGTI